MIDYHCHLDLYPDPRLVVAECLARGISVLSVTTTPSAWTGTTALSKGQLGIRTALGLHPQIAGQRQSELRLFDQLLASAEYVGEIGLDGAPEFKSTWQNQVLVFEHILKSCRAAGGRTLSIHSRRAASEVLDRLERWPGAGKAILHWFSGNQTELKRAIDLGCLFSVGPAMLSSDKGRMLASRMPKDRVLTESDGPFAQLNGRSAMPWDVKLAVAELASMWKATQEDVQNILQGNLERLAASPPTAL